MYSLTKFILLVANFTAILCAIAPVEKCSLNDAACTKQSAQKYVPILTAGIPEINAEPLDVMHVDAISFELAGLILNMRNVDVKGLQKAHIDKMSVDPTKKQMSLVYRADIDMRGQYKASGQLLILPISGDGDFVMTFKTMVITLTMGYDIGKSKDGKDVIELKNYKFNHDVKDDAHFELTNLFNGNKQLSETLLKFMNENWKALVEEFGAAVMEIPMRKVFTSIKKFLRAQPLEEITNL